MWNDGKSIVCIGIREPVLYFFFGHLELWDFFFFFPGPYLKHMEVPRLGVELELDL